MCVATTADVGVGEVRIFDRDNGGVDVDVEDVPVAPAGTTRLVVDAEIGMRYTCATTTTISRLL